MKTLERLAGLFFIALGVGGLIYGWSVAGWPQDGVELVSCVLTHFAAAVFILLGSILWLSA